MAPGKHLKHLSHYPKDSPIQFETDEARVNSRQMWSEDMAPAEVKCNVKQQKEKRN